jgi:hypothetical protein
LVLLDLFDRSGHDYNGRGIIDWRHLPCRRPRQGQEHNPKEHASSFEGTSFKSHCSCPFFALAIILGSRGILTWAHGENCRWEVQDARPESRGERKVDKREKIVRLNQLWFPPAAAASLENMEPKQSISKRWEKNMCVRVPSGNGRN